MSHWRKLPALVAPPGHPWPTTDPTPEEITAAAKGGLLDQRDALRAAIYDLIECGEEIRCYPSGAVGFDDWYEAQARAQALLGEFLTEDGEWHASS